MYYIIYIYSIVNVILKILHFKIVVHCWSNRSSGHVIMLFYACCQFCLQVLSICEWMVITYSNYKYLPNIFAKKCAQRACKPQIAALK